MLEKDYGLISKPEELEAANVAGALINAAKQLELIENLKKDEFETTAEIQVRKQRLVEASTAELELRFILP